MLKADLAIPHTRTHVRAQTHAHSVVASSQPAVVQSLCCTQINEPKMNLRLYKHQCPNKRSNNASVYT